MSNARWTDGAAVVNITRFGFEWGSMVVERLADDPRGGTWVRVSSLGRSQGYVDVRVSARGATVQLVEDAT